MVPTDTSWLPTMTESSQRRMQVLREVRAGASCSMVLSVFAAIHPPPLRVPPRAEALSRSREQRALGCCRSALTLTNWPEGIARQLPSSIDEALYSEGGRFNLNTPKVKCLFNSGLNRKMRFQPHISPANNPNINLLELYTFLRTGYGNREITLDFRPSAGRHLKNCSLPASTML